MISVVIPLYNKEEFISDTLISVLEQSYINYELLVINDGSTDKSLELVQSFDDKRIKIISIENSGVSAARNIGIENAKYNWIAFLDADDWWAPTFLEEMIAVIESYPLNKIFASGRSRVFDSKTDRYYNKYLPNHGETGLVNYFKVISNYLPPINASNVVISKSLFSDVGNFRIGQKNHEDHDLWIRLCANRPLIFVNKLLSFYRKTIINSASTDSYSSKDFSIYLETLLKVDKILNSDDKIYFDMYVNRFVLLTYLKYYNSYSKNECLEISNLIRGLLHGKYRSILPIINLLPFNMYPVLKTLKR